MHHLPFFCLLLISLAAPLQAEQPNIVIFTLDDMDQSSVGVYGCPLEDITPNIDRLAAEGMRFDRAHVPTAVCQPSRQSLMSGQHAHRNGTFGFVDLPEDAWTMGKMLNEAGYYTASIGKGRDYSPIAVHGWDFFVHWAHNWNRQPGHFEELAAAVIEKAHERGEPFFLNINSSDPHRPFIGGLQEKERQRGMRKWLPRWMENNQLAEDVLGGEPEVDDYLIQFGYEIAFERGEVPVPGYLPDIPVVRRELTEYFSSVQRGDEALGEILDLIEELDLVDETIFVFFSDHGASLPSSKNDTFVQSTRVPFVIRWPGKTEAGTVDAAHFVSTMDLLPTFAETLGRNVPDNLDGRSILPLLNGEASEDRDSIFTAYNYYKPGKQVFPTRAITTQRYHYMWQPWVSQQAKKPSTESHQGRSFGAIRRAAKEDTEVADWLRRYEQRSEEALYDLEADPFCQNNLAGDPKFSDVLFRLRSELVEEMNASEDPLLPVFEGQKAVTDVFEF